eukprot:359987-Pleurochrysis_carterae.AAC.3
MVCFPRLHVIADNASVISHMYERVPNTTVYQSSYPPPLETAGTSKIGAGYWQMQWFIMWADNYTVAPHVLFFDTDSVLTAPLRCHHLFNEQEVPLWYTWQWASGPPWLKSTNEVLENNGHHLGELTRRNFMTFFPVTVPRAVLPVARQLAINALKTNTFDEAWARIAMPSHVDLLGKVASALLPSSIDVIHCPAVGRINQLISDRVAAKQVSNRCFDFISITEHIKHPIRDCHTGNCHHLSRASSHQYWKSLRRHLDGFMHGREEMPAQLYHYQYNRSSELKKRLEAHFLSPDRAGRVCGQA